jgi:hypothetical protein
VANDPVCNYNCTKSVDHGRDAKLHNFYFIDSEYNSVMNVVHSRTPIIEKHWHKACFVNASVHAVHGKGEGGDHRATEVWKK